MSYDKQSEVVFDKVRVPKKNLIGKLNQGWQIVEDTLQRAAVGKCAEMVGGNQAALEMAVNYGKDRVQFDRPIGGFQAIQHHCANMLVDIHSSRFLTYEAAWKMSEGIPAALEASMAKAWVSEASRRVTALGHQVFGGIGFTVDVDMHLYYRRAKTGELFFGDSAHHRKTVAEQIGL